VGAIEALSGGKKRDWIQPLERWTIAIGGGRGRIGASRASAAKSLLGNSFCAPRLRHPGVNDGAIGSEFGSETGLWPEL